MFYITCCSALKRHYNCSISARFNAYGELLIKQNEF